MGFRQGFLDRRKWVKLARSLDYTFEDVQKVYTSIALKLNSLNLFDKTTYTLGHISYWLLNEPMFLEDIEVAQLEGDKKRWIREGRNLIDLHLYKNTVNLP